MCVLKFTDTCCRLHCCVWAWSLNLNLSIKWVTAHHSVRGGVAKGLANGPLIIWYQCFLSSHSHCTSHSVPVSFLFIGSSASTHTPLRSHMSPFHSRCKIPVMAVHTMRERLLILICEISCFLPKKPLYSHWRRQVCGPSAVANLSE